MKTRYLAIKNVGRKYVIFLQMVLQFQKKLLPLQPNN